jgi:hypothetical protein
MKKKPSAEFLLISECVTLLERGMWGNAPRSLPVTNAKKNKKSGATFLSGLALNGKKRQHWCGTLRWVGSCLSTFVHGMGAPRKAKSWSLFRQRY